MGYAHHNHRIKMKMFKIYHMLYHNKSTWIKIWWHNNKILVVNFKVIPPSINKINIEFLNSMDKFINLGCKIIMGNNKCILNNIALINNNLAVIIFINDNVV